MVKAEIYYKLSKFAKNEIGKSINTMKWIRFDLGIKTLLDDLLLLLLCLDERDMPLCVKMAGSTGRLVENPVTCRLFRHLCSISEALSGAILTEYKPSWAINRLLPHMWYSRISILPVFHLIIREIPKGGIEPAMDWRSYHVNVMGNRGLDRLYGGCCLQATGLRCQKVEI